ncbi:MAG: signal peptide peptidase SppA [Pseudomonadota bacterium]
MASRNPLFRLLGGVWRVVDGTRRAFVNLIFVIFIVLLLSYVFSSGGEVTLPSQAALVIAPDGNLVNQLEGDALDRATREFTGDELRQTLVRDIVEAITLAKDDGRIKAIVLDLDGMWGAGLSKLQTVAAALDEFKASGKKVIAFGDAYLQNQYYLAAHADQVYMHPLGVVFLQGYGTYQTYYKEALDKLSIDWNIFRVGEFKSAVEPYSRNDMSDENRQSTMIWLSKLWQDYKEGVSTARGFDSDKVQVYADTFVSELKVQNGDMAQLALQQQMVDELLTRQEAREKIVNLVGRNEKTDTFNQVGYERYLEVQRLSSLSLSANKVGVVVATGTIVGGNQPPGAIGGDSTAQLIRRAARDDDVKAVVLQVDSGGGSMFASEVILRELEQLKATGKPLYVSMSSVAASGGYYIALAGEEIWAHPSTITGSIGVYSMFPTFDRAIGKLGLNVDGFGTTKLAGAIRPDRALSEEGRAVLQLGVEGSYATFLDRVATARGLEVDAVDEVARGRVWIGSDARDLGLVDQLGSLSDVIQKAAEHAGVADDYSVKYIERELGFTDSLLLAFLSKAKSTEAKFTQRTDVGMAGRWFEGLVAEFKTLAKFNDPRNLYYYCFCSVN